MTASDAPYHAHLYYTAETRAQAETVRAHLAAHAPRPCFIGELRDYAVGPHPLPQFEIHFLRHELAGLLPVLEASGLRVLVHPLTDDDLADHTRLGHWIGDPLPLDLTTLDPPGMNQGIARFGRSDF